MYCLNSKLRSLLLNDLTRFSSRPHVSSYFKTRKCIYKCQFGKYSYFSAFKDIVQKNICKKLQVLCLKYQFKHLYNFSCRLNPYVIGNMPKYLKYNLLQIRCVHLSSKMLQSTNYHSKAQEKHSTVLYICSLFVFMIGLSYAAVPLYRIFCQATGIGGDPTIGHKIDALETMKPIRERKIHVSFNADHHSSMEWNFKPSQQQITVVPGETALAFYTAKNPTNKPIVGIATYNVVPFQAGLYFNKIQCFCFEEQWLNPNEEVDMPVFFYIDPDYDDDPVLCDTDDIILSYTFFKAEEGQTLPLPGFMKANSVVNLNKVAN